MIGPHVRILVSASFNMTSKLYNRKRYIYLAYLSVPIKYSFYALQVFHRQIISNFHEEKCEPAILISACSIINHIGGIWNN